VSDLSRIRRFFGGFAAVAAVVLSTLGLSLFIINAKLVEWQAAYSTLTKVAAIHAASLPNIATADLFTTLIVVVLAGCVIGIPLLMYAFRHLYHLQGWCACAEELLSAKINGRDMQALGVNDAGRIELATPAMIRRLGATKKWLNGRKIDEVLRETATGYVLVDADGGMSPVTISRIRIEKNPADLYVVCT